MTVQLVSGLVAVWCATDDYGCACGWEGPRSALIVLGTDGKPLPPLISGQLSVSEAA